MTKVIHAYIGSNLGAIDIATMKDTYFDAHV